MPPASDILGGPVHVYNHPTERAPTFVAAAKDACDLQAFAEECTTRTDVPQRVNEAFGTLLNQILNDWVDLLQACAFGMGRPAFRSARSIFELSLFGLDLSMTSQLQAGTLITTSSTSCNSPSSATSRASPVPD